MANGAAVVSLRLYGASGHRGYFVERTAVHPCVATAVLLLFVAFRLLKQIGVAFLESLPLPDLLVEAEVATRTRAPSVVFGKAEAALVKDALDVGEIEAKILEGIDRCDVWLLGQHDRLAAPV